MIIVLSILAILFGLHLLFKYAMKLYLEDLYEAVSDHSAYYEALDAAAKEKEILRNFH